MDERSEGNIKGTILLIIKLCSWVTEAIAYIS